MPSGKQQPASGLALEFARYLTSELTHRRLSTADLAKAMGKSTNYVWERLRGDRVFNLAEMQAAAELFELAPEELLIRVRHEALRRYEGDLIPLYGMVMSAQRGMEVYQIPGSGVPVGNPMDVGALSDDEAAALGMETIHLDSESDNLDITSEVKSSYGRAAQRGRRKADEPHAE